MKKILPLIIILIAIDQLSKFIIRHSGGFYICNTGIAFGIKIPTFLIITVCLVIVLIILKLSNSKLIQNLPRRQAGSKFKIQNSAIILIISGAISNLIDRFFFGCIVDFIDLRFWPVFNLADVFICLGAIMIVIRHPGLDPGSRTKQKNQ